MKKIIVKADAAIRDMENGTVNGRINAAWKPAFKSKTFVLKGNFGGRYEINANQGDKVSFLTLKN